MRDQHVEATDSTQTTRLVPEPAPPDYIDPVVEAYKKDVDRTLLRENLKLTFEQRIRKAESLHRSLEQVQEAGRRAREKKQ